MNDEKIITAIKNRNEAAINETITKYSKLLWSVAEAVLSHTGSVQDVEECVADTFIYLWEHPEKFDHQRGKLKTWLSIVARTQAVNRYREITKRNTLPLEDTDFIDQLSVVDAVLEAETRNHVWTLSNSSSVADYYLYNTYNPMAGETVPGEESFSLEYRKVDLYPFEDNLLESVSSSAVTLPLDEVISLCNQLVGAITNQEDYTVDYVHAYGTNGRRLYYKLVYKRVLDGMPVTGYNDLIFLVDSDGIEKVYGSIFDVEKVELQEPIISVEAAAAVLSGNIAQVSFGNNEMLSIGKITLEYLVSQNMMGEASIIPVWRFWIGDTEDQMNLNRGKIIAVDAVTGELIQGERGHTF